MPRTKEIITAAGTFACAIGIGFVMQSSDTAAKRYGTAGVLSTGQMNALASADAVLDVESIILTSAELDASAELDVNVELPAMEEEVRTLYAPESTLSVPEAPEVAIVQECTIDAEARPVAAALVKLSMTAACLPNERVSVHHNGMIFTETTSAEGTLDLTVPALAEDAVFILAFTNGEGAVAQTKVEELADFSRVVLQWKGQTGFQIHAREFGAGYGDTGHVWSGAPRDMTAAITGAGGFITRNGDVAAAEPLMAEVYTFPISMANEAGDIDLSVETEVIAENCGLEIEAQSLEMLEGGRIKSQDLTLAVPDCDAIGTFLVLNNLLQDMKVALN